MLVDSSPPGFADMTIAGWETNNSCDSTSFFHSFKWLLDIVYEKKYCKFTQMFFRRVFKDQGSLKTVDQCSFLECIITMICLSIRDIGPTAPGRNPDLCVKADSKCERISSSKQWWKALSIYTLSMTTSLSLLGHKRSDKDERKKESVLSYCWLFFFFSFSNSE